MRVGIDTSPLIQTRAGTARHVRGLVHALRGRKGLELELLSFGGPGRLSSVARDAAWYPYRLARRVRALDVLHCTTFRGPVDSKVPTVVTVHDLAILRYPDAFPRWHRHYGSFGLRPVLRSADAIVALSEFTKDEVVALAAIPPERIRVVPNGVDEIFLRPRASDESPSYNLSQGASGAALAPATEPNGPGRNTPSYKLSQGEYVLAVATLEPRKNLRRAVEAARLAGIELRVVGARGWGRVDVPGWVGEIPDAELADLYRGARCVVYASLYEGFGIPVLEAMASGTPVVTSRGGATEEVAGGAAVLVDPLDIRSIAAGIAEAQERRDELVPLGLARAREFTWERAADAVQALWSELA